MLENENVEFKQMYTENIFKEIVAFLNSGYGSIYIGYDDDGNLIGLDDVKKVEEKISNLLNLKIVPDCSMFVSINTKTLDNKEFVVINVSKGINVYSLKDKGIVKGTYIRKGSCSIPATEETIKQMILLSSGLTFETSVSTIQGLTFNYISSAFNDINIDINDENIKRNLKLYNEENKYTNLALLLSDQNPYTIKIAAYVSSEKSNFLDRKEISGSLLEIYDKSLDYLKLNSATYGLIDNSVRNDIEEYPEFILREILLNSIIHRDYSSLTSNIINIYKDSSIEFISYGPLYGNITVEDILSGLSTSRNPYLQSIFMRLKRVEAIGSGLRRIDSYYKERNLSFDIKALPSSFVVTLPRILLDNNINKNNDFDCNNEQKKVVNYLNENDEITRKEAEQLIKKEKTTTSNLLNDMVNNHILMKIGKGPSTKYKLV